MASNSSETDNSSKTETVEPSKSQRKRDARALLQLASQLVELPHSALARLPLPQELREAIEATRPIRSRGARKRQLQFVGKLLRNSDSNSIIIGLERARQQARTEQARWRRAEQWCDRLINEGDSALQALLEDHPEADRQRLRQMIRNARRETQQKGGSKAAAEISRLVTELLRED